MNNFQLLIQGFGTAFSFANIIAVFLGGILGLFVGAMPGLGGVSGVALLLPLTFKMNPTTAIIFLAAIYYGNMYGGAYSAILLNIPGDSPAVMTALDGFPMSTQGRAGKALFAANTSSFLGGSFGILTLTIFGPLLAIFGLKFGPAEVTMLILLALTSIGWLLGEHIGKGLIAASIGMLLSIIGIDNMSGGMPRYIFGMPSLLGGISFVPIVIGMFGITQVMELMEPSESESIVTGRRLTLRESILNKKDLKRMAAPIIKGAVLGNVIGFLPGAGGTTASFLAYVFHKKTSKFGEEMGKGAIDGVCVSEAANNSAAVGAFAPLLSLGIPGSSTAVVLYGGLMMWGLTPGPLLFTEQPQFVWGLIASMYIGNVACFLLGTGIIPFLMSILKIPKKIMIPVIITVCMVGSYAINNSMFDVWFMFGSGVAAYLLKKNDYPIPPILLAFVLAPMFEQSIRRAFTISQGSPLIFIQKPISAFLLAIIVALLVLPALINRIKTSRKSIGTEEK
jgi:putative tricarboxylic transport membrane protein